MGNCYKSKILKLRLNLYLLSLVHTWYRVIFFFECHFVWIFHIFFFSLLLFIKNIYFSPILIYKVFPVNIKFIFIFITSYVTLFSSHGWLNSKLANIYRCIQCPVITIINSMLFFFLFFLSLFKIVIYFVLIQMNPMNNSWNNKWIKKRAHQWLNTSCGNDYLI